jgi:hypothetical protein
MPAMPAINQASNQQYDNRFILNILTASLAQLETAATNIHVNDFVTRCSTRTFVPMFKIEVVSTRKTDQIVNEYFRSRLVSRPL